MVRGVLGVPIEGSIALFFAGAALSLFATTSMGIFMATLARNMPQFGMLMMLTIMPLQMLSGGTTPRESMPEIVQNIMLIAPTTHFVELSQAILYRGAGLETVWQPFLALAPSARCCFSCRWHAFAKRSARWPDRLTARVGTQPSKEFDHEQ
jgi:ABC-2 type transport system permease protein